MIGDSQMPTDSFTVTGGAYGSTGSLVSTTSIAAMEQAGANIVQASIASPGSLPVDLYISEDGAPEEHLFSGEYLTGDFNYRADLITIHARDWSGPLVDQKRALTNLISGSSAALAPEEKPVGINTQNQTISKLVTQIANQFSLTPDLRLNSNISNGDADFGAVFGDTTDTILTTTPQTPWGILTKLAKQTGNIVYVTPEKHLVFGEAGAGLDKLTFTWRQTAGGLPLLDLRITHNPRRNLTFRVLVKSYDPTLQQLTSGQAYVIGTNYSTDSGSTVHAGSWGGANASQISSAVGTGKGTGKNAIPVYTYHVDGLTASQAQTRAESIAADIAKRELVAEAEADLVTGMAPGQIVMLTGQIDQEFAAHTYYVTAFSHVFKIGARGRPSGKLQTNFKVLDRQPEGQGKPVKKPAPVG